MSEAQTDEGLADFDYLSGAGLKSTILVNPSLVSSFLADSFPPRLAYSRELCRRSLHFTPAGGSLRACDP